uniref:Uncharacterized protein n=1 Tax=Cannabis sativa TaxID=3483 RepID=A0A803Q3M6_CANSA
MAPIRMRLFSTLVVAVMAVSAIQNVAAADAPAPSPTSDATAFVPAGSDRESHDFSNVTSSILFCWSPSRWLWVSGEAPLAIRQWSSLALLPLLILWLELCGGLSRAGVWALECVILAT